MRTRNQLSASGSTSIKRAFPTSKTPGIKLVWLKKVLVKSLGLTVTNIFFPIAKHSSIHVILGMTAQNNYELEQMDVQIAFLHGELEDNIYMLQPEGFVDMEQEKLVCKLKRPLYGLKQSSRQWYKRFNSFISTLGFNQSQYYC